MSINNDIAPFLCYGTFSLEDIGYNSFLGVFLFTLSSTTLICCGMVNMGSYMLCKSNINANGHYNSRVSEPESLTSAQHPPKHYINGGEHEGPANNDPTNQPDLPIPAEQVPSPDLAIRAEGSPHRGPDYRV
ncbi:hypothetical protein Droror1_Dr00003111 [Drosera rotundifolia]